MSCDCILQEEEVDSNTMMKSSSESDGTMRATGTMSDGVQTMIAHDGTMLESDLGTMVINSDDDEEEEDLGSMRSEPLCLYLLTIIFVALWEMWCKSGVLSSK